MNSQSSKGEEKIRRVISCKGYLYYTSTRKSKGRNPLCVGIPRTLPQLPNFVDDSEEWKQGRKLVDFYYGCLGYSIYRNAIPDKNIDHNHNHNHNHIMAKTLIHDEIPNCIGLKITVGNEGNNKSENAHVPAPAPAHVHNKEDRSEVPQPRTYRPTLPSHSAGDDFYNRFTRNTNVVASGVARNIGRVGNFVKESVEDVLFPYRRPPK